MSFHATNYTVSIAIVMVLTLFTAGVRMRKPLEHNWPFIYWIIIAAVSFWYPDETFDPRIVLFGIASGFLLRFEFLGRPAVVLMKIIELAVWAYILYTGLLIVTTA